MSEVAKWRPYPNYRYSGVEWLGMVPVHWETKKIKRLCLVKRGASPRPIEDPIYFDDEGEYAWVRISDVTSSSKYLIKTEQKLSKLGKSKSVAIEPGELFLSIAATVGKPIIASIKCCIHDGFVYFVGLNENREYMFYLFSSGELYKGLGKLGTQLNLNTDTIGDIRLPVPAPPEQRAIAAFLDRQTAKIDTLIAKKDRLIELLQEKRAALISRAVTKGLDPSAPMKDSGVEWLGEIPAHWKVEELNRHWQIIDCKHRTASYVDEGIHIVSTTEVKPGRLDLSQTRKTTYEEYMNLTEGNRLPRRGNIIYTRNASLGSAAYVDTDEPFCMGQDVCLINSYDQNQLFLNYQLNSPVVIQQLEALMVGATFRRINVGQIKKFVIIRPPKEEQQQIAKYLDGVSERIDILVAKINGSMEKLKEYRTTIISAAVTGKIDVRNQFEFIEESSWHEGSHG